MIEPPSLESKVLASVFVATSSGDVSLTLARGEVLMVAGPNGAGKSALLYSIYRSIGKGLADYYAGHRQITFNHGWENVSSDKDQLATYQFENFSSSNRYKNHWSEDVFNSIIKRLFQDEVKYNSDLVELLDHDPINAQKFKKTNPSPIAKLNSVFDAARMAVRFEVDVRGLRATRGIGKYDIDQLSDGERAALFIAGAILIQDPAYPLHACVHNVPQ
ncbi:ABC-type glutathione transport system ATPase component [Erythromicrobium ramosum]|uniref:ABC-type glutathione transport system ATPase component n=1 Tax=Erythrobacter ramosus TaxID=35811 RepID=A0A6I4UJZ6_9SPHN|nr:ATP-binding cassette domain-containing protein [Erythrobacter ramosus]MBB3775722.1 ABC-type glutathione transport system ATPase component [Erythrobacter ramosus]MXP39182.1 ATP-binding cassette domain-containing protein [Erythrobacter ramosus]